MLSVRICRILVFSKKPCNRITLEVRIINYILRVMQRSIQEVDPSSRIRFFRIGFPELFMPEFILPEFIPTESRFPELFRDFFVIFLF